MLEDLFPAFALISGEKGEQTTASSCEDLLC